MNMVFVMFLVVYEFEVIIDFEGFYINTLSCCCTFNKISVDSSLNIEVSFSSMY